jgi:hypothetical protein
MRIYKGDGRGIKRGIKSGTEGGSNWEEGDSKMGKGEIERGGE